MPHANHFEGEGVRVGVGRQKVDRIDGVAIVRVVEVVCAPSVEHHGAARGTRADE